MRGIRIHIVHREMMIDEDPAGRPEWALCPPTNQGRPALDIRDRNDEENQWPANGDMTRARPASRLENLARFNDKVSASTRAPYQPRRI